MIKRILFMIAILLACVTPTIAQDTTTPFVCLPEFGLDKLEARSIWVGYERGGWDIPDDAVLVYRHNRGWSNTFEIDYSAGEDEYYVFVFDTEPVYEKAYDGTWRWSWHPCGQGAITPEQYELIIGGN